MIGYAERVEHRQAREADARPCAHAANVRTTSPRRLKSATAALEPGEHPESHRIAGDAK
jgi:hypothetical protein